MRAAVVRQWLRFRRRAGFASPPSCVVQRPTNQSQALDNQLPRPAAASATSADKMKVKVKGEVGSKLPKSHSVWYLCNVVPTQATYQLLLG